MRRLRFEQVQAIREMMRASRQMRSIGGMLHVSSRRAWSKSCWRLYRGWQGR